MSEQTEVSFDTALMMAIHTTPPCFVCSEHQLVYDG